MSEPTDDHGDRLARLERTSGAVFEQLTAKIEGLESQLDAANSDDAIRVRLADTRRLHAYAAVLNAVREVGVHLDTGDVTLTAEAVCRAVRRIADADE